MFAFSPELCNIAKNVLHNINSKNHHGFHSPSVASSASENAVDLTSHFHSFSILWCPSLHSMTYSGPCYHHRSPVGLLSLLPLPPTHLHTATKIIYLKSVVFISLHLQLSGPCPRLQASLSSPCHSTFSNLTEFSMAPGKSHVWSISAVLAGMSFSLISHISTIIQWRFVKLLQCARHCSGFWGCNSESGKHGLLTGSPSNHWHSGLVETIG